MSRADAPPPRGRGFESVDATYQIVIYGKTR